MRSAHRPIVVSNRLPYVIQRDGERYQALPGSGGLIAALLPVLRGMGGAWIGWSGMAGEDPGVQQALDEAGDGLFSMHAIALSQEEVDQFYHGFANEIIWPLFHDLASLCNFVPAYWQSYLQVNRRYARAVADQAGGESFVWVHDYQLMHVGAELRRLGHTGPVAYFLHIPFPSIDLFLQLPWRRAIVRALADYDLLGFQTLRDRRNFLQCLQALIPEAAVSGRGQVVDVRIGERRLRVGHFPIGIDYAGVAGAAASEPVAERVRELHKLLPDRTLILGIDRLDYTKGIPLRLHAFRNALERYPELRAKVTLIQVVVPSREPIPSYHDLRLQIEQIIGRINGEFTAPGNWVPIHYVFRSLDHLDLSAYYRAAGIALVTPLKDGMNLVAKEYCAASIEEDCVLILSEFAGAAAQLRGGALLVNPYDIEGMADAIVRAVRMERPERLRRMRKMRRDTQRRDVFWWVDSFLKAAELPVAPNGIGNGSASTSVLGDQRAGGAF
ncbi:MAG: trehalose-6-phosphate synthase [Gammaproteobacteria bacterium]|nr:trehalose-6-phosphate synthase [Gammaproteobacteria bacterium]